jgi:hypothetical protein
MKRIIIQTAFLMIAAGVSTQLLAQAGPYQYYSLTPCRVIDTRNAAGTNGGPSLTTVARDFQIRGNCGVPVGAKAVSLNVTATNASTASWLTLWPSGTAKPFVSTINFDSSVGALANGAIVALSANTNDLSVANAAGAVHVILDVTGYFQ